MLSHWEILNSETGVYNFLAVSIQIIQQNCKYKIKIVHLSGLINYIDNFTCQKLWGFVLQLEKNWFSLELTGCQNRKFNIRKAKVLSEADKIFPYWCRKYARTSDSVGNILQTADLVIIAGGADVTGGVRGPGDTVHAGAVVIQPCKKGICQKMLAV